MEKLLNQERAARHDLEMHIESLNNQKQRMTAENSSISAQLEKGSVSSVCGDNILVYFVSLYTMQRICLSISCYHLSFFSQGAV